MFLYTREPSDDAITRADVIAATFESKRSAPIPATSPTLSPTLSAITAGFLGSSSAIPSSTFPVRSADTSAVFVNIPPPAFAKSARELAPNEKPRSMLVSPTSISTAATPKSEHPTTRSPITAPPLNPTRNASLRPLSAASAVLPFERVATIIPIFPAIAESMVPAM